MSDRIVDGIVAKLYGDPEPTADEVVQELLNDWFEAERRLAHEFSSDPCASIVATYEHAQQRATALGIDPPPRPEYEIEMHDRWRNN